MLLGHPLRLMWSTSVINFQEVFVTLSGSILDHRVMRQKFSNKDKTSKKKTIKLA